MNGAAAERGARERRERRGAEDARRLRNARESLEPLSTTNEARCIARFAIRAALISPGPLTLGKSLWRSAHAKVSFPRTKVTGEPKPDEEMHGTVCFVVAAMAVWEWKVRVASKDFRIKDKSPVRCDRVVSSLL